MNLYNKLSASLAKLKVNERNMTKDQKEQYKNQILNLKKQIADDGTKMMIEIIMMNIKPAQDGKTEAWDNMMSRVENILEQWKNAGMLEKLSQILFKTYDINKFIEEIMPMRYEVLFKGYGDYWLSYIQETEDNKFKYYNSIIDMYWNEEINKWMPVKIENGKKVFVHQTDDVLPPNKILLEEEYRVKMEQYK